MSEFSEIYQENNRIVEEPVGRIESLRDLNENQEFIGFLEEHYQFKELNYRTKGFMVGKNSFCQDIKNQRIFPATFSLHRLSISVVEQQEVIAEEVPWQTNIRFMAGNIPYDILANSRGMQIKSGYSIDKKPRKLDIKYVPKLLVGLISASADANNYAFWNQEDLKEIEELNEVDPDDMPAMIKDLLGSLADVEGDCTFSVHTPVLVNEQGVGMQVQLNENFNIDESVSDIKIDMAIENPLGIMVYSFVNKSYTEDEQKSYSYVCRQAIDGSVRDMELDMDLYGYKPTIIDRQKDKETFDQITKKLDATLSGFMRDLHEI